MEAAADGANRTGVLLKDAWDSQIKQRAKTPRLAELIAAGLLIRGAKDQAIIPTGAATMGDGVITQISNQKIVGSILLTPHVVQQIVLGEQTNGVSLIVK